MTNSKLLLVLLIAVTVSLVTSMPRRKKKKASDSNFEKADDNGDGFVDREELEHFMDERSEGTVYYKYVREWFETADGNDDKKLDKTEFKKVPGM